MKMQVQVQTEEQEQQERQEQQQEGAQRAREAATKKHWLQYDIATGRVVLLQNYEPGKEKARWASVSPDKQTIVAKNSAIAKNLKGKLLLIHGDIDNNVHPANTLRLVDALIKASKRFDMLMIPGKRHGFADAGDYAFWVRADCFARHLLSASADTVDIVELNREKEIKR